MRILVYKRTHNGDPDYNGCFGAHDCMGSVRALNYDAVIGIGGIGSEAKSWGIAEKVNWIGIGPQKTFVRGKRGPEVRFEHFLDFDKNGPEFAAAAPKLAERIYSRNVRYLVHLAGEEYNEAHAVVRLAQSAPPSGSQLPGPSGEKSAGRGDSSCGSEGPIRERTVC